jgi:hypothetical protein
MFGQSEKQHELIGDRPRSSWRDFCQAKARQWKRVSSLDGSRCSALMVALLTAATLATK